jgi:hypothetical protein
MRNSKYTAGFADVLSKNDDARVAPHLAAQSLVDRLRHRSHCHARAIAYSKGGRRAIGRLNSRLRWCGVRSCRPFRLNLILWPEGREGASLRTRRNRGTR